MSYNHLIYPNYDLASPDGKISQLKKFSPQKAEAIVSIEEIQPNFRGFVIEKEQIFFNLKSTLAQVGLEANALEIELHPKRLFAEVKIELLAIHPLGEKVLTILEEGCYIGKLFALEQDRRVRDPSYLLRYFGRSDREGRPLLSLGSFEGKEEMILEKVEGRTIAYLSLLPGTLRYDETIEGFLPTLIQGLKTPELPMRRLLSLHQRWMEGTSRQVKEKKLLLLRSEPLHIRTVFARVVNELLPEGVNHTSASVLQPDTDASGDVYELFGENPNEITQIPLEFYTLDPYKEHVYFSDRDQLQDCLENETAIFDAFQTAPAPTHHKCTTFVVKGTQLLALEPKDWIVKEAEPSEFPGATHLEKQAILIQRYLEQQASYPYLKAIQEELITSQGILLSRYFPSPVMKRMLLSEQIQRCLKGIYFKYPSRSYGEYFSHEDRALLFDLSKFGIPVFWADERSQKLLQYIPKPEKDTGMFVPIRAIDIFAKSVMVGVYGSNLIAGNFEEELKELLKGLLIMKKEMDHPLLNPERPLALVTGGGPGAMSVGNKVAHEVGILSCANIVDFTAKSQSFAPEQEQNPYIEAKMTYRLDRLVERQGEFNLDLPIILTGGIGSDFEYTLEEVRRKVGGFRPTPVLLFGDPEYWKQKITSRYHCNIETGTIVGSEWVSNCFYCIQNAKQGLQIYKKFFAGQLPIGKEFPPAPDGFFTI